MNYVGTVLDYVELCRVMSGYVDLCRVMSGYACGKVEKKLHKKNVFVSDF